MTEGPTGKAKGHRRSPLPHIQGAALRDMRVRRGLQQGELAEKVGVARNMIGRLEDGTTGGSIGLLHRLAGALNCPVERIMYVADDRTCSICTPILHEIADALGCTVQQMPAVIGEIAHRRSA